MRSVFSIRRDERIVAVVAVLVFSALNVLMMYKYYPYFTRGGNLGFWSVFHNRFCVSGFDCLTYITISRWKILYTLYRHPLLAALMFPFASLNHWLMTEYEFNYAIYIVAVILVFCALYSFLFIYRTLKDVVGVERKDAILLTTMLFSFAYMMLTVMVPDHFCVSLFLLSMTLYIAGRRIKSGKSMQWWQTCLLFFFTTGVTTTNGVKILLASWFANGRRFFSWRNILGGIALPLALLAGAYFYQHYAFVVPDTQKVNANVEKKRKENAQYAKKLDEHREWMKQQSGKPIGDSDFFQFTNVSSPRMESVVENMLGEGIVLHRDQLLKDINRDRPVFEKYRCWGVYVLEFILFVLFVMGVLCGWHDKFLRLCMTWLGFDMILHLGLGFGINEIYIMSAHWMFVIPIVYAYLLKSLRKQLRPYLRGFLLVLTLLLLCYNGYLISLYMMNMPV